MTTIHLVREEILALMALLQNERDPERVRALGEVLERLNARHERLEAELVADDPVLYVGERVPISRVLADLDDDREPGDVVAGKL